MNKVRVLVVEDSLTVRERLLEVLAADPEVEVVGQGNNGQAAIDLCRLLRPDVITLDMHMPLLDGLAATEHIMGHFPTPILIVSASTNRGELFRTYDALAAGAVDVLEKPRGDASDDSWEKKFLSTVKLVSRIKVITHPRARLSSLAHSNLAAASLAPRAPSMAASRVTWGATVDNAIVALGASTGGPGSLVEVIRGIPSDVVATLIVVLHIDEPFGVAFADWLSNQTGRRVAYAVEGDTVESARGRVVMARPGRHLIVKNGRFMTHLEAERHSCRPAIDVLFESLAAEAGPRTIGCLLTGMGRDGASGLLAIRRAGGKTFAQDEATSVVYGMPREAALLGAAERILPLGEIGHSIAQMLRQEG